MQTRHSMIDRIEETLIAALLGLMTAVTFAMSSRATCSTRTSSGRWN